MTEETNDNLVAKNVASGKWKMRSHKNKEAAISRKVKAKDTSSLPPYTMPHKFLPLLRGIPIRDHARPNAAMTDLPPISLPIEAQNSIAYHLEVAGLVHVDDLKAMADENGNINVSKLPEALIVHLKPEHGPDIQINPGTWVAKAALTKKELETEITGVGPVDPTNFDLETASADELKLLEEVIRAARIEKVRRDNVDVHVEMPEDSGESAT
ncbi:minor tail protein [Gordonia phage GMA2]|uniref:Uncharacterized protein n=1 Tax=Gordonia phage GMA2 TaxID=1647283 RepID=A0A0K0N6L4_9CAUD|nr:minor tail protein [Gordonia phage GMA2]AKJ72569.1 hypothetical protein GMA2_31 [Gordonia phage GMA2]